jgi:AbrB family looped-hinge helix DNA binding protein
MELAKVTSKGQITIPADIRKRLRLKPGDKVLFFEDEGRVMIENSSLVALSTIQQAMADQGRKTGVSTEDEVVDLVKEIRSSR